MINAGTGVFAEPALQPAVQTLAQKAFAQKTAAEVRQFFEKNIATLPNAQAQVQALTFLADYEQYHGNYSNAAECYRRAAGLDTSEGKTELLLDAVRALLCGGSMDSARSLLSEIAAALPVSDEDPYYRRAAVYDTWRLLAEDRADRAVPLITAYTKKKLLRSIILHCYLHCGGSTAMKRQNSACLKNTPPVWKRRLLTELLRCNRLLFGI